MVTYEVHVCIGQDDPEKRVAVKCHDTGVNLMVYLNVCRPGRWIDSMEPYQIPAGSTAVLKIAKPDKTYCVCDGELVNGGVFFKLPSQAFTAAGVALAEVSLFGEDSRRLTSATFDIHVPQECVCDSTEDSEPYVDVMAKQIKTAVDAAETATKEAQKVEEAVAHSPIISDAGTWLVWDSDKGEYVDTGVSVSGSTQPDWNQNDASAADYVKNRPCYMTTKPISYDFEIKTPTGNAAWSVAHPPVWLQSGNEYTVTCNDTTYVCTCVDGKIGNEHIVDATAEDTGEPFYFSDYVTWQNVTMLQMYWKDVSSATLSVTYNQRVYHTMPDEYLPNTVSDSKRVDFLKALGIPDLLYITITGDEKSGYTASHDRGVIAYAINNGMEPICTYNKSTNANAPDYLIFRLARNARNKELTFYSVAPDKTLYVLRLFDRSVSLDSYDVSTGKDLRSFRNSICWPISFSYGYPGEWYINAGAISFEEILKDPRKYSVGYVSRTGYSNQPLFLTHLTDTEAIWSATALDGSYVGFKYSTTKSECGWISGTMDIPGQLTPVFVAGNADDGWTFTINNNEYTVVDTARIISSSPSNYCLVLIDGDFDYYCLSIYRDYSTNGRLVFETFDGENYHGGKFISSMDDSGEQVVEFSTYVRASSAADKSLGLTDTSAGQMVKISAVDDSGAPTAWETIDGYTGQVTADKISNPDHPTDLMQYAAFQAAVPMVQQMNISGATVGQIIKVKAVDGNGSPTQWEAVDMLSGGGGEKEWELIAEQTVAEEVQYITFNVAAGKSYDSIIIIDDMPQASENGSVEVRLNNQRITLGINFITSDELLYSRKRVYLWTRVSDEYVIGIFSEGTINQVGFNKNSFFGFSNYTGGKITSVRYGSLMNNVQLPVGTNIKVYGR